VGAQGSASGSSPCSKRHGAAAAMPFFGSKSARRSQIASEAAAAARQRQSERDSSTVTGPLPKRCDVRGREGKTDNTPQKKAKIAVEYEHNGRKDRKTAACEAGAAVLWVPAVQPP